MASVELTTEQVIDLCASCRPNESASPARVGGRRRNFTRTADRIRRATTAPLECRVRLGMGLNVGRRARIACR